MSYSGISKSSFDSSPISTKKDDYSADWISDERVEQSSSLFSQLDSMIAAVQSESSALDNMRDKVKELDTMKDTVSELNRRLQAADEANFAMKTALVRQQEQMAEVRRAQSEVSYSTCH
jgi:predicted nuclease with TOPRIM domain